MSLTQNKAYNITSLNEGGKTQAAGKGLAVAGASGLAISLLAALLPFVGVLGTSVVVGLVGIFLLIKR
jgi:hypothetical protein